MAGFAKDGTLYPTGGVYGINDDIVSSDTGWSSQKIMNKLASVKSIIRVDAKPTIADGTVTYIKGGASYTTTDQETWFYYVVDEELYKTIFIDGVEYTKADSDVNFDDFVAKTDIVTTLDDTVTDKQVTGALAVYNKTKNRYMTTYASLASLGLEKGCSVGDIFLAMPACSIGRFDYNYGELNILDMPLDAKESGILMIDKTNDGRFSIMFRPSATGSVKKNNLYLGILKGSDGSGLTWQKVCTTSIADIPKTRITFDDITQYTPAGYETENNYMVENGVCYISLALSCITANALWSTIASGLPKNKFDGGGVNFLTSDSTTDAQPAVCVTLDGELRIISGTTGGKRGRIFFSYPVADN